MAGAYRLVIKGHDGHQLGVLSAYQSLTYTKKRSAAGEAVLVAHYGVTAATDALLDQIVPDTILEVWRHPDPSDATLDWYVDWIGFHVKPKKEIETPVPSELGTWQFKHVNSLLTRRLVQPLADHPIIEEGNVAAAGKWRSSGLLPNAMRWLVREHCIYPDDERRRMPGLYSSDDVTLPGVPLATSGGMVFGETTDIQRMLYAVMCSKVWGSTLYIGTYSTNPSYSIWRSNNGSTWSLNGAQPGYCACSLAVFNDGGGERLFAGSGRQSNYSGNGVWRSDAANPPTAWTKVWAPTRCNVVPALCVHAGQIYAGTGWGIYYTGGLWYCYGQIVRSANGTVWSQVFDGNVSGTGSSSDKYIAFEGLYSFGGYIYAGAVYEKLVSRSGVWSLIQYEAHIIRSQTGNVGTWTNVLTVVGPTYQFKALSGYGTASYTVSIDGFCCFAENGGYLYVGIGDRWHPVCADMGRIYRTINGVTWEQVFGADQDATSTNSSHGVTSLCTFNGSLYAGMGGTKSGDGTVWENTGADWSESFDGRGLNYPITHTLSEFSGNLYAGFGWIPNMTSNINQEPTWYTGTQGLGKLWRMNISGDWDADSWEQEISGRWSNLLDLLSKMTAWSLDKDGGIDFYLEPVDLGGTIQEFVFMVVSPEDHRSTSSSPTLFGIARGNMTEPYYILRDGDGPTMVYVMAEGAEAGRRILEFHNVDAEGRSPWGRIEGTVDAQGVETPYEIWALAQATLTNSGPVEQFGFKILQTPATRYGVEWDAGWLVTAQALDLTAHCKIESVTVNLGSNPVVEDITTEIRLLEII